MSNDYVGRMKTVTTREFFHAPSLVTSLDPGQSLIVTEKGDPKFTVTRTGRRPIKTAANLRREARKMFPSPWPKVNFTALMKSLKK